MAQRNHYALEVHFGRAQWVATDDQLTAKQVIDLLLRDGHSPNSVRIRTGDDELKTQEWLVIAENIAAVTGVRFIH
jgi:hypothetical protein